MPLCCCLVTAVLTVSATSTRLSLGINLKLALAVEIGFEFGEHAEHVEEALGGRGAAAGDQARDAVVTYPAAG
jgi:hypothetical protein